MGKGRLGNFELNDKEECGSKGTAFSCTYATTGHFQVFRLLFLQLFLSSTFMTHPFELRCTLYKFLTAWRAKNVVSVCRRSRYWTAVWFVMSGIRHHAQVLSEYSDSLGQHFDSLNSLLRNGTVWHSLNILFRCRKRKHTVKQATHFFIFIFIYF